MKRPLGFVALIYMGGLVMAEFFGPPLPLLFSISLLVAAVALAWRRARAWLIWPLIFLTGWTNLTWRTAIVSPHDLRAQFTDAPEEAIVRGHLLETPTERLYVHDETESSHTLARLSVVSVRRDTGWEPAAGEVIVTTPGTLPGEFFAGQSVEISGVIAPPRMPLAEGLFDYHTYLRRQGIYFELKTA